MYKKPIYPPMRETIYDDYVSLISDFLEHRLVIKDFEQQYFTKMQKEPGGMSQPLYYVLQGLFEDIDAYTTDKSLIEDYPEDYITEEQLRESAKRVLSEVKRLKTDFYA